MIWYKNNNNDIILSTRIRLARNLDDTPFPNALKDKKNATDKIKSAVINSNSTLSKDFQFINLDNISDNEKQALAEEHMISFDMLKGKEKSVLLNKDKTMSIMLMEEDHIRLQVILDGYQLDKAWELADKVDDVIEENIMYAFDEEIGYLTACPTNVGTGLRASVMMHLPALSAIGKIERLVSSAGSMGITIRGMYGEGSRAYGDIYQISNQITLGESEKEIIERVKNIVDQIKELETQARKNLLKNNKDEITDKVYRAYGTLKYARKISSSESKALLSQVLLGQAMGIIKEKGKIPVVEIMVLTEPAILSGLKNVSPDERDRKRANYIRENI